MLHQNISTISGHTIDLYSHLIPHPVASYMVRVSGDSMVGRGILDGDILVVDRSIKPSHDFVVVASYFGEFTVKILDAKNGCLLPANPNYPTLYITDECEFSLRVS